MIRVMPKPMSLLKPPVPILLLGLGFLGVWRLAIALWIQPATFGESNYQANCIRIESYLSQDPAPKLALIGSSLTGRLLPEYFDPPFRHAVANLGLDGGTPWAGLIVLNRREELPEIVCIETYLLDAEPSANDRALVRQLEEPGIALALADPLFRAEYRPSALLYNQMKRRRDPVIVQEVEDTLPSPPATAWQRPKSFAGRMDRSPPSHTLTPFIVNLRDHGVRVILLDMPKGDTAPPEVSIENRTSDSAAAWAEVWQVERLDLRHVLGHNGWIPHYTDGIHLDSPSARHLVRMLSRYLALQPARTINGAKGH